MILQFALVAQSVAVDRFTNRLSLFNICERIEVPRFPVLMAEVAFVATLRREDGDPATFDTFLNIRLGEAQMGQANMHIDFEDQLLNRQIVNFQGLPVLTPGELRFGFNLPDGSAVGVTVPVVQIPAPPSQVAGTH